MKKVKVFGVFFIIVLCMFLTSCSFGGKEDDKDNNKEDNKEDNISHVHQYNNGLCSCGATIDVIYKVVFLDYNGTILKEQKVAKGEAAIAPNNPSREGYNFVGWSSNYSQINNDLAIVAQYSIIESAPHQHNYVNGVCSCGDVEVAKYNVTFIDYNGSVLKEETVEKNQSVAAPANPSRTGYIFTGWSNEFENITSDLVIVALYNIDVPEGHEHIYIKGVCSCGDALNEYFTVVFKDYNGKVLKEELVLNFTTANPPTVPIRDGYLFTGWSNSFSSVEHDLEVITQYKENNIVDHEHDLIETHYDPTCIESSYNLFACNSCDYQYKSTSGFKYSHYIENNVCVNCNSIVDENGFVLYFDEETNGYSIVGYTGDEIIYELPSSHNSIPITKIGDCAFSDPTEFYREIKLPKDLLIIGNYAFEYANFVSIELPDTVIAIEESAFFSSEIANIKLSNSLQTIQDFAFCECDNLNSIILPDSLISIGEAAFADCGALSSVHIGKNLQKMGIEAFAYNDSMLNITVDEENNYFTVEDGMLYSKDKSILYYYFSSKLQEALVIPEFVKIIREDSLYYSSEEIIYLPKDLIELSFNANRNVDLYFNGSLKEWFNVKVDRLSLYGGNLYLKNNDDEYQNFAEIKELVIPDGITKINSKSIPNDNIIEKIVIPNTVVEIENYAFRYVYNLKKVEMTSSVKKVGSSILPSCNFDLFYNGTLEEFNEIEYSKTEDSFLLNAHNIYTKNSLNEYEELKEREIFINSTNFGNCSQKDKITSVIISKDLTSIDYDAFSGWSSLESIEIPNSVTSIGGYAFENCSSLKNIVIPNSVTSIGSAAFIGCDSLKSITLPFVGETINGTTNTNFEYIFGVNEPSSLKEVIINGPCIIRSNAFEYLNVKTIKFMSEVKEIESGALFRISNRTNIYLSKDIEIINDYIFETSMMGEYYSLIIYSDALEKPSTWGELWRYDYPEYYGECTIYYNADENTHYEKDGKHYFLNLDTKEATLTTYLGDSEIVEIDETIIVNDIEFTVTKIGDFAFAACKNIKKIILNDSLNTIGNKAFVSCTNLTDLYIGKNVINVGVAIISSTNTVVLCEAESKPEGWDENWINFEANWSCNENNTY